MQAEKELNEEEAKELKDFLNQNPDLAPKENEYDPTIKALYSIDEPFALEKELLHTPSTKFTLWKPISIAASVALVIAISILVFKNSNNKTVQLASKAQKQSSLSTQVAKPIAKTNISYSSSNNQNPITCNPITKSNSPKTITTPQPSQSLCSEPQTNIEQAQPKKDTLQTSFAEEKTQNPASIRVNTLVVYAQPDTKKQDTVHIYSNSLCTFSTKRPRNKIRFIVPESITNFLAKL